MKKYRIDQIKKIGDRYYSYQGVAGKGGRHVYDEALTKSRKTEALKKKKNGK